MDWLQILGVLGLGALSGTIITQLMTNARDRRSQRVAYLKQQLEQFYGPLLAAHKEIRARSELRVKVQQAIDAKHAKAMAEAAVMIAAAGTGEVLTHADLINAASDVHLPTIKTNIEDESQTFREVLMPRYRSMIDTFRDKMTLAEPETREYFARLVEFVDVWDKIIGNKLSRSIAPEINHSEANLAPFYKHLEEVHDRLRGEVAGTEGRLRRLLRCSR